LDSTRTISIGGIVRPAVMACENERPELSESFESAYCVDWGETAQKSDGRGFQTTVCTITYWTCGTAALSGIDRGRILTNMDSTLCKMLLPRMTPKVDLTVVPPVELGSRVFWGAPKFAAAEQVGMKLQRTATIDVHFFAEEEL
jgi:hypothetical protein